MSKSRRDALCAVILFALGLLSGSKASASAIGPLSDAQITVFHHVRITSQDGERFAWSGSSQGRVLIVNWASWCAACVAELPRLVRLQQESGGRLKVVVLSMPEHRSADLAYATSHPLGIGLYFPEFANPEERLAIRLSKTAPDGRIVTSFPAMTLWTADGRYLAGSIGSIDAASAAFKEMLSPPVRVVSRTE